MQFTRTYIESIGYDLAPHTVTSVELEERIASVLERLRIPRGQLEALTGIRERRWWSPGQSMHEPAARAGRRALQEAGIAPNALGMLIYAGVCRDNLEPATACAVADALDVPSDCRVFDISNACLGVMNGIVQVATAIELGHVRAGLVVSCESARQIVDLMIDRLLHEPSMERFKTTLATLTGGSGAIGVLVVDESLSTRGHRLLGGVLRNSVRHHRLCRWGPDSGVPTSGPQIMETHAIGVLEHGVELGIETWNAFRPAVEWPADAPDKVICHQVGSANRDAILRAIQIPVERDFSTYPYLGNIGTVSLPISAAIAEQRGFLQQGDRVGMLGIGSGLNCIMLGVEW